MSGAGESVEQRGSELSQICAIVRTSVFRLTSLPAGNWHVVRFACRAVTMVCIIWERTASVGADRVSTSEKQAHELAWRSTHSNEQNYTSNYR